MKKGSGERLQQVVNGETVIFNKRETAMRRDAAILRRARPIVTHEQPLVCATVNCERVRMAGSRYCPACFEDGAAIDRWGFQHDDGEHVTLTPFEITGRAGRRLKTFALVALFVGLMSLLGYFVGAAMVGQ